MIYFICAPNGAERWYVSLLLDANADQSSLFRDVAVVPTAAAADAEEVVDVAEEEAAEEEVVVAVVVTESP